MCSGLAGVGPVGTGLEIPAGSAGMGMKPQVEGQTESCRTDQGASRGWGDFSGGEV